LLYDQYKRLSPDLYHRGGWTTPIGFSTSIKLHAMQQRLFGHCCRRHSWRLSCTKWRGDGKRTTERAGATQYLEGTYCFLKVAKNLFNLPAFDDNGDELGCSCSQWDEHSDQLSIDAPTCQPHPGSNRHNYFVDQTNPLDSTTSDSRNADATAYALCGRHRLWPGVDYSTQSQCGSESVFCSS
jgi:hypothetical protein